MVFSHFVFGIWSFGEDVELDTGQEDGNLQDGVCYMVCARGTKPPRERFGKMCTLINPEGCSQKIQSTTRDLSSVFILI